MENPLSIQSLQELQQFINSRIDRCLRKIYDIAYDSEFTSDLSQQEIEALQQEADGSVCLVFETGRAIEFYPLTETFSLKYDSDSYPDNNDLIDVSGNFFWKNRIGSIITDIHLLCSDHREEPYGIRFTLSNKLHFELIYLWEDDSLIIRG